ncbi:tRNA (N6-threonylcarbamoyladenosine(37)-N6)-methyltransferase TrmO [Streptomyces sp. 3MP-14]|uniref:tRNA (N6-threonylcarbamoyladenosine(37)-N6)-methyltransferase TrmO n=1 Tax=Streptomyces mimosae TaxID=2586635 RepID=A0A5N6AB86_9ACTN|nr:MULTISPECIES: SAM-dependent methyltransferase [Streptomyces]KAB8165293.1 tRNA (N6-threonylcarbamoyladenosine(37)-N6)-methyltransferase TrmO [Streptomyces mimosae]KAB8175925.1 tRNA (N6-threonylcarbamoyladenosine(37)-N6)-methyltransferase TrmO [Streptomyces sp. 3MP-14]
MSEFTVVPVARVVGGRVEPTDDYWGGTRAIVRIDSERFGAGSVVGLEEFSHLEVVYRFHLTEVDGPVEPHSEVRHPRNNPAWPATGIFAQRNMLRLNSLGVSRCRLLKVDGLDLHVEDLDAVDGTPVLDIKPWVAELGPRGEVRQPAWPTEMLADYYAPGHDGRD